MVREWPMKKAVQVDILATGGERGNAGEEVEWEIGEAEIDPSVSLDIVRESGERVKGDGHRVTRFVSS